MAGIASSLARASRVTRAVVLAALAGAGLGAGVPARAADPVVLTVPREGQFETLDPQRSYDGFSYEVLRNLYSNLLTYSYLERPYKLVPELLAAMPSLSADRLTLTFTLRPGVRFADDPCFPGGKGRVVTSDDVLFSLRRYADARVNVKTWFAMKGAVVGLDEFHAASEKAAPEVDFSGRDIAGLHKVDATTFTIRLTQPSPLFLYALTLSSTSIVPVEAVRFYKERLSVHAVGTGPFHLVGDADRKGTLHLLRNPDYFGTYPSVGEPGDAARGLLKDAGKRLPLVDVLDMPLIEEAQPEALKFLHGDIDWYNADRASFARLARRGPDGEFRIVDAESARIGLAVTPEPSVMYLAVNMKDALLGTNKKLRQALAAAVDVQEQIERLKNGRGRAIASVVPYELPGNERDTGTPVRHRDLALARRLLAEAGFPNGAGLPPITFTLFRADAEAHDLADLLRTQLAAVGVKLRPVYMDMPTYDKAVIAGNFQLVLGYWLVDYPDAENVYQLLYSRNAAPGPNMGDWVNAAYDRAYEASRLMPDGPARLAHFKAMDALIVDEAPVFDLWNPLRVSFYRSWLLNFKRNPMLPEEMFLRIDTDKRKAP